MNREATLQQFEKLNASRKQLNELIEREVGERIDRHRERMKAVKLMSEGAAPLAFLAHGDSWFDYPLRGNGPILEDTDIIACLKAMGSPKPEICNISHFGDAASVELSLPKLKRMAKALKDPQCWGASGKPDAILFSGGGDDIVGDVLSIFINDKASGTSGLNTTRLDEGLGIVEASYKCLFDFRNKHAPNVPIFGHCYDFPVVDNVSPICAGPWLHPSVSYRGWSDNEGTGIVHDALIEFKNLLVRMASDADNQFYLIETQGNLHARDWANELHPRPAGFQRMADLFLAALKLHFRGRI